MTGQKLGVVRIQASRGYRVVKEFREVLLIVAVAFIGILTISTGVARYALIAALVILMAAVIGLRTRSWLSQALKPSVTRNGRAGNG